MNLTPQQGGTELRKLARLGWPILLAQSAQTAMGLADTLMASRAGNSELAAIALGAGIWLPLYLSLSGIMLALTPVIAYLVGAERESDTPRELHQNLLLAVLLAIGAFIFLNNAGFILQYLDTSAQLAERTQQYLHAISWGFLFLLPYQSLRSFAEGFGLTRATMRIGLFAVALNIPLNYLLIFGKLGLPALGGVGCGWASSIAFFVMFLLGLKLLRQAPRLHLLAIWQPPVRVHWPALGHQLNIGIPIAIALLIETSMFCFIALLLADQGSVVLAAHQITLSISSFIFMLPLSLCLALTIRVGHLLGAGKVSNARFVSGLGLLLALGIALICFSLMRFLAAPLANLYSADPAVVMLSAQLLGLAALYQFSDALQLAATGALRGFKDTRVPLLAAFIAYWVIGLPCGYYLAEHQQRGAAGYWIGILIGLSFAAVLLITRLHRVTRHASPAREPATSPD